jgi:AcrR family transcriptional regulator
MTRNFQGVIRSLKFRTFSMLHTKSLGINASHTRNWDRLGYFGVLSGGRMNVQQKGHTDARLRPTRQKLINEVAHQIEKDGPESIGVDAVLVAVGVTKGSLYHHFESIDELMHAALLKVFADGIEEGIHAFQAMSEECSSADEVRERIRLLVQDTQGEMRRWRRGLRARVFSLSLVDSSFGAKVSELQRTLTDAIAEVMSEFQTRGWLRSDVNPHAFAVFIQAFTFGRLIDDVLVDEHKLQQTDWNHVVNIVADHFFQSV